MMSKAVTATVSYKDKNSVHNSPEDWIIFENTQEAIVDEETWLTVQKIRETKHRLTKKGDINPLTGLVYCADCGAKMFNHRTSGYEKKDKDGNPTGKYTNAQDNYTCSTYSKAKSKFGYMKRTNLPVTESSRLIFISSMWVKWVSQCRSLLPNR